MKVCIMVPHPDDEVLGFGGIIQKHIEKGNNVSVVFAEASDCQRSHTQQNHTKEVASFLGYSPFWLKINASNLTNPSQKTITIIEEFLANLLPDILYLPSLLDTHQSHSGLFNNARIATRMYGKAPIKQIFCGEIPSSTDCSITQISRPFSPTHFEILTQEQIEKKVDALSIYAEEVRTFPHPRSKEGIITYAKKRGMECNNLYAEAFECLRYIE